MHLAYNLGTGEVLTTNHGNHLKRWVARHTRNDYAWYRAQGQECPVYRWVFAHGKDSDDCVAKLLVRHPIGG